MKKLQTSVLLALAALAAFSVQGQIIYPSGGGAGSATNVSLDASGVVQAPAGTTLVATFSSAGTNVINTLSTAAAQANNLMTPTGGVLTNRGSMIITNGQLVISYATKTGTETNTILNTIGAISFGGALSMNPGFTLFKQAPWVQNGPVLTEQWGQDVPAGEIWANYNSGIGAGAYRMVIAEGLLSGGVNATNATYPNGAIWYVQDEQGRPLFKNDFAAADGAGEKQAESKIFDIEYSLHTNNSSDYGWVNTNVYRMNLATNGVVQFGPLQSPVPVILSNTLYSDWTGTVLPWWSMNTNAAWLGNGGVMVSNQYTFSTNTLNAFGTWGGGTVLSASGPYIWSGNSYTNASSAAAFFFTNNGVFYQAIKRSNGVSQGSNSTGYSSLTWTNAGTNLNASTSFFTGTNQYTYVFSNAAPRVIINNPIVIGTAYSNSLNVKLEGRATFFLTSSAVSGFPGLTYSNFTTGVTETITNGIVLAGTESRNFFFSVYPAEVIGFYQGSSGSATATMQTNNLSYP